MKKNIITAFISAALFFTASPVVFAQTDADAILKSLAAAVKGLGNYTVSFRVTAEGNAAVGEYTVSGNRYYMSMGDSEIFSDGKVRYEVDHSEDEVVIGNVDLDERDILANPTKVFDFAGDTFSASYKGVMNEGGKQYDIVELKPKNGDTSLKNVELTVNKSTKLPHSVSYLADGVTGYIVLEVLRIGSAPNVPDALFTPDLSLLKDYEIIRW